MKKKIIIGIILILLGSIGINIPTENLEQIYCKIKPSECTEMEE